MNSPTALADCAHDNSGRMHCIHWFAQQIGAPVDWVRHNMRKVPHHKRGRRVLFTDSDVDEFLRITKVDPGDSPEIQLSDLSRARQAAKSK